MGQAPAARLHLGQRTAHGQTASAHGRAVRDQQKVGHSTSPSKERKERGGRAEGHGAISLTGRIPYGQRPAPQSATPRWRWGRAVPDHEHREHRAKRGEEDEGGHWQQPAAAEQ
eukprot:9406176-Pyramimonas_sp.AAC.1